MVRFLALTAAACFATSALSQAESCRQDALLVFDGSGSMAETGFNLLETPRIFEARRAVRDAIPRVTPFRRLGLMIYGADYGAGQAEECSNISLRFPPMANAADRIIAEIDALEPSGPTPLAASVGQAADVLDYTRRPGVIVVVTDGKESCGGTPCALASDLARDAAALTIHVIGFKVRSDYFDWTDDSASAYLDRAIKSRCMAEITGGVFSSTETVDELVAALQQMLGCALIGAVATDFARG